MTETTQLLETPAGWDRRPTLFCCALVVLTALSLSAAAAQADESLSGQALDVEDEG